jgi:hypothetical protein
VLVFAVKDVGMAINRMARVLESGSARYVQRKYVPAWVGVGEVDPWSEHMTVLVGHVWICIAAMIVIL